jgi:hypothetical protein
MATTSGLPAPYRSGDDLYRVGDFHVSELAADLAGSLSPFGPDVEFPLPVGRLRYRHPTPANRPHLAEDR